MRTKREEYLICQERGHVAEAYMLYGKSVCSKCGTIFWSTNLDHEESVPAPDPDDREPPPPAVYSGEWPMNR